MPLSGPILIIDNDLEDQGFITTVLHQIDPAIHFHCFYNGQDALDYLVKTTEHPFLIICDVHMQGMSGLELRKSINDNEQLRKKSIPFVFLSDYATEKNVNEAYDMTVQGFFEKANTQQDLQHQLHLIINYWKSCLHPNRYFIS
ncbi:MAG TPA: response regulator [Chitinophaga sp.]|uniref:response regulator n=1 Tax=Chitinophaga sp. TaxID=1869181 RepID=UPI002DBA0A7A|nr:response regulator [Chitinophaga sp.]HEU4554795.1 response regulator [Chitinophaga sp.]